MNDSLKSQNPRSHRPEDQPDILLALLVENIRSARGTPDAVARDLLECHRQRLVEQRAPLTPKELDMMNCTFAFDLQTPLPEFVPKRCPFLSTHQSS